METDAEAIMTPDAEDAPVLEPATLTGESGTVYTAIDLMTEMNGYHEQALVELVAPVAGRIPELIEGFEGDDKAKIGFDIAALATLLVTHQMHRRVLALLFLPSDDRRFKPDDVEERAKDFMGLMLEDVVKALAGFFTGASGSFRRISAAFSTPKNGTSTKPTTGN